MWVWASDIDFMMSLVQQRKGILESSRLYDWDKCMCWISCRPAGGVWEQILLLLSPCYARNNHACRQLTGKIPSDCCLTLPLLMTNEEENQTRKKLRRCDLLRSAAATVCALWLRLHQTEATSSAANCILRSVSVRAVSRKLYFYCSFMNILDSSTSVWWWHGGWREHWIEYE